MLTPFLRRASVRVKALFYLFVRLLKCGFTFKSLNKRGDCIMNLKSEYFTEEALEKEKK